MKKLLKEVWKSFSKSKIVLAGLTFLVFLTSGIITLLFDVVNAFNKDYTYYKQVSRLQDLTMNSNIEPRGSKPNQVYEPTGTPNIWQQISPKNNNLQSIRINTDEPYIDLKQLNSAYAASTFVDTKQLNYILNANQNRISEKDGKKTFSPDKSQNNSLNLYNPLLDGEDKLDYAQISQLANFNKIEKGFLFGYNKKQTNKISDLLNKEDFYPLVVDITNNNAYIVNETFLDANIADVTNYKANPKRFLRIEPWQVAK